VRDLVSSPLGYGQQAPDNATPPTRSLESDRRTGIPAYNPMSRGWCAGQHIEQHGRSLGAPGRLYLSLSDAIALAVENNLDVELERYIFPVG